MSWLYEIHISFSWYKINKTPTIYLFYHQRLPYLQNRRWRMEKLIYFLHKYSCFFKFGKWNLRLNIILFQHLSHTENSIRKLVGRFYILWVNSTI